MAGDQQASLVGQGCLEAGQAKCTYGTGAFLLAHTGSRMVLSRKGLLATRAASLGNEPPQYALEGSVFIAGAAVQWLRDGLKAIGAAPEIGSLAQQADPNSEVIFVPALTGLGAPFWEPSARGTIFGLSRGTSLGDVARATLEGVAFQITDLIESVEDDLGGPLSDLKADGGMARSDPFLQFQADILGQPVRRSPQTESTALGAALLAGLGVGLWADRKVALELLDSGGQTFTPARDYAWRARALGAGGGPSRRSSVTIGRKRSGEPATVPGFEPLLPRRRFAFRVAILSGLECCSRLIQARGVSSNGTENWNRSVMHEFYRGYEAEISLISLEFSPTGRIITILRCAADTTHRIGLVEEL